MAVFKPVRISVHINCTSFQKIFLWLRHLHLHWFNCEFQSSTRPVMDSSNFFAWDPGFKTLTSPHWEQGSIHHLFRPEHHAPGTAWLRPRLRIFASTMSSTGSPFLNCLAKAAPLSAIWTKSDVLRKWGSIFGGLSQIRYLKSLFTVVFINSGELQTTEWKYPSSDKTTLVKYMRRVRGRLSQPSTQNSRKDRLRMTHGEPAK